MPREHERVDHFSEIKLHSASGNLDVRISDLSLGGCYVDTIVGVSIGESLSFDLVTPEGETLHFTGEVAYVLDGQGFGIKFTDFGDKERSFLEKVIGDAG
jgi:hypothetical protein